MSTKKTTDQLSWKSLSEQFTIGDIKIDGKTVHVNALQDAINDGTLTAMVKDAAEQLNDGDMHAVYAQLSMNLSSWLTNSKKASYRPNAKADKERYDTLRKFVSDGLVSTRDDGRSNTKSYWQWSIEEIEAITDYKTAKSVYDNLASYKQKKLDREIDTELFEDATIRQKAARSKMNELKPIEDPTTAALIEKLTSGKRLTKAESIEVAKLLKK